MKVQIVVTHLLGSGHLVRAATLARAFNAAGHRVQLISGGAPVAHLDLCGLDVVQLPPLHSDGTNFTRLMTAQGDPASDSDLAERRNMLLRHFDAFAPDVLITELFPFGRRSLRAEFLALLARAQSAAHPVLRLCSIRDVLAPPSKPAKADWVRGVVSEWFHGVLVHSDADLLPLEKSWPVDHTLAAKLHYTGFVAAPLPPTSDIASGEILVSAGGGPVGDALFQVAAEAANRDARRWRLLIGGAGAKTRANVLASRTRATCEPARPDFRALLQEARLSISLCGYNTALDVLQSGIPAVFVPFDADGETEQTLRATALSSLPGLQVLTAAQLTRDAVVQHANAALREPTRRNRLVADGASRTVHLAEALYRGL